MDVSAKKQFRRLVFFICLTGLLSLLISQEAFSDASPSKPKPAVKTQAQSKSKKESSNALRNKSKNQAKKSKKSKKPKKPVEGPTPKMQSACFTMDGKLISGENINELYPVASLTKIFTSFWALKTYGLEHRFLTRAFVSAKAGSHELHLQGGGDPYMARVHVQYLVSALNQAGIYKLSKVTFDENFFLVGRIPDASLIRGDYEISSPSKEMTQKALRNIFKNINSGYRELRQEVEKAHDVELPAELRISLDDGNPQSEDEIAFLAKNQFQSVKGGLLITLPSVRLLSMVKYMNSHSHNYISEALFDGLGGASKLTEFLVQNADIKRTDFSILNGSGNNDGNNKYTQANCKAVLKTLYNMVKFLNQNQQKSTSALGVVSVDLDTGSFYKSEMTDDAVVAKTGTVRKAVGLAGIASTQKGKIYFSFTYQMPNMSYFNRGRLAIKQRLIDLIDKNGGPKELGAQKSDEYDPFDDKNVLILSSTNMKSVPLPTDN